MKKTLLSSSLLLVACTAVLAQTPIDIVASDMPVNGDKLLYSASLPTVSLNLSTTGPNVAWDYSYLTPAAQAIDTYKTAVGAGYFGGGIALNAYGYKIADTLGFPGAPVSARNVYTFFNIKSNPSRFVAEGFGATISSFPIAAGYAREDTFYTFPMTFGSGDTTTFRLNASFAGIGSLKQEGTRMRTVDGWGTITTPYFTAPVAVIRVRSEVMEQDTISFGGTDIPIPRHYVEYKWLAKNEHYPALFVTTTVFGGNETPTAVRYRDMQRALNVASPAAGYTVLQAYPNPAVSNEINVSVPAAWTTFRLRLYNTAGQLLAQTSNSPRMTTGALPAGKYMIIAENGAEVGMAHFSK